MTDPETRRQQPDAERNNNPTRPQKLRPQKIRVIGEICGLKVPSSLCAISFEVGEISLRFDCCSAPLAGCGDGLAINRVGDISRGEYPG